MKTTLAIITFFALLLAQQIHAQQISEADIDQMVDVAFEMEYRDPDSAFVLAKEILKISQNQNYQAGVGYALTRLGSIKNRLAQNDSALYFTNKAIKVRVALGDFQGSINLCKLLFYIYRDQGEMDSSFAALYKGLEINKKLNNSYVLIDFYKELGSLYLQYGQMDDALNYLNQAQQKITETKDSTLLVYVQLALGDYYFKTKDLHKALTLYLKVNQTLDQGDNLELLVKNYNNLAVCYADLEDYSLASMFYLKAAQVYREIKSPLDESLIYYNLACLYYNRQMQDSAIYFAGKSKIMAEVNGDIRREALCNWVLSKAHAAKEDYYMAYETHQKYMQLTDSIVSLDKISAIAEMQTKYETEKKEQQIKLLDQENKAKSAERNFFLTGSLVLLLLVLILILYVIQRTKIAKKNAEIAQQKIETLVDEQEIKTFNAMIEGQEEERMRIAGDLHDRLGSMLSTIKLLFSALEDKIDTAGKESKDKLGKATELIDDAVVEVRRISHNLGSGMVANFGLIDSISELCDSIDQSGKISCQFLHHGLQEKIPLRVEVEIYRIIQETVNNALKHSKANKLTIQLNQLDKELQLSIEDNGKGFDVDEAKEEEGMGLANIEKRANKINAKVFFDSRVGRGTSIIVEIPLNFEA